MLPKNKTQIYRMEKLKIFPEADHPFGDFTLIPYIPKNRPFRVPGVGWPLPVGLEPINEEKYSFRTKANPPGPHRPELDFLNLMTEEERSRARRTMS